MAVEPIRILIVDDTESDRAHLRYLLGQHSDLAYVVEQINHGRLAVEACQRFRPDCVLLDFHMPGPDGLQVLSLLRRQFPPLAFAVILMTGAGHERLAVEALQNGAQDYLPKSGLSEELLQRAVRNALHNLTLERQKQEAERKLRHAVDAAPCALYTIQLIEERALFISGFSESLTGYTPAELDVLAPASFLQLVHPDDHSILHQHAAELSQSTEDKFETAVFECEFRVRPKEGGWRWIAIQDRVAAFDNGRASIATGAATDITHRKQMAEALEQSQFHLVLAQEAAGIGTWAWSRDTATFDTSSLFYTLYGRADAGSDPIGAWSGWVHDEDRPSVDAALEKAWQGAPFEAEFRVIWPNESIHWLQARGKRIQEPGQPPRLVGATLDITAKKRADEELRRSNEDLERFAYVASHDLQEPLRTMVSFSELFARRNKDVDAESKQFLDYVYQGGRRMQSLIGDLLTFSRATQSVQEPMEEVNCNELLSDALSNLKKLIAESGAEIHCGQLPTLVGDATQLIQVFENLVSNALKYRSERTPLIDISATRITRAWQFCVTDNGIGFEMQYASRIFEAFKRLHSRDAIPGTGLGLAISKRIVERHGGQMWTNSQLGLGSKFFFTLSAIN